MLISVQLRYEVLLNTERVTGLSTILLEDFEVNWNFDGLIEFVVFIQHVLSDEVVMTDVILKCVSYDFGRLTIAGFDISLRTNNQMS